MTEENYYQASAFREISTTKLEGEHRYDVCVVGKDVTGLSSAIYLPIKVFKFAYLKHRRLVMEHQVEMVVNLSLALVQRCPQFGN